MSLFVPLLEFNQRIIAKLKAWASQERGRQSQLAQTLGVSRATVSDWFSGKAMPSWETGRKIEAFLKALHHPRKSGPNP